MLRKGEAWIGSEWTVIDQPEVGCSGIILPGNAINDETGERGRYFAAGKGKKCGLRADG